MSRINRLLVALALAVALTFAAAASVSACPYDPPPQDQQNPPL
ncbi:MAG TPA: hypothetical protein VL354_11180 [Spirochaetia bacterium]|nr:hypothetical protein [Spirochaetia bacterium]